MKKRDYDDWRMYKGGISFLCFLLSVVLAIAIGLLLSKFGVPLRGAGWVLIGIVIRLILFFTVEFGARRIKDFFRSPFPFFAIEYGARRIKGFFCPLTKKQAHATGRQSVHETAAPPEKLDLEEPWEFEFVLTDEEMRRRIMDFVEPNFYDPPNSMDYRLSWSNLNLAYGVMEQRHHVFLTHSYFLSQNIKRVDDFNDDRYVALTETGAFSVYRENEIIVPRGCERYLELAKQAIDYYWTSNCKDDFLTQNKDQIEQSFETEKERYKLRQEFKYRVIRQLRDTNTKDVRSLHGAMKLYLCAFCDAEILKKYCSKSVVSQYSQYATAQRELEWRSIAYIRFLKKLKKGTRDPGLAACGLQIVNNLLRQGVSDSKVKLYAETWESLFRTGSVPEWELLDNLKEFIATYRDRYAAQMEQLQPVLEMYERIYHSPYILPASAPAAGGTESSLRPDASPFGRSE